MSRSQLKYGLYAWWVPQSRPPGLLPDPFDGVIHPDDLEIAIALDPFQKLLINTGQEGDYLVLQYGSHVFRGKPSDLWVPKTGDGLLVGDQVDVLPRGGRNTPKHGVIHSMTWQYKHARPVYRITADGKPLKKNYSREDFVLVRCEPEGILSD